MECYQLNFITTVSWRYLSVSYKSGHLHLGWTCKIRCICNCYGIMIYFLSISVQFQQCDISMVLQSDTMAMCSNPGEQVAVETLLSMRNSMCIGSGDESSVMSEDESRCTPSPTSSFQSSDEDSMSISAEPSIFNRNSKLARVSFQSPMTYVL